MSIELTIESAKYVGWIPNTTGHVYFRNAGLSLFGVDEIQSSPPEMIRNNAPFRSLFFTSLCDMNDFNPTDKYFKYTRFIVRAESKNKGTLNGSVWIISTNLDLESDSEEALFHSKLIYLFNKMSKKSHSIRDENAHLSDLADYPSSLRSLEKNCVKLLADAEKNSHFKCKLSKVNFTVSNHGFAYLKTIQSSDGNIDCQKTPTCLNARMAYLYLKSILHSHTHHTPELDTLCRLHYIPDDENERTNDLSLCMVRDLKADLVELKLRRATKPAFVRMAEGITCYAKGLLLSFFAEGKRLDHKAFLKVDDPLHHHLVTRQTSYIDQLLRSIQVIGKQHQAASLKKIIPLATSIIAFIFMLLTPILLVWRSTINSDDFSKTGYLAPYFNEIMTKSGLDGFAHFIISIVILCYFSAFAYLWVRESREIKWPFLAAYKRWVRKSFPAFITPATLEECTTDGVMATNRDKLDKAYKRLFIDRYWNKGETTEEIRKRRNHRLKILILSTFLAIIMALPHSISAIYHFIIDVGKIFFPT